MRREKKRSICCGDAELEDRRVLEEERALLREEQIEPREVHLLLVGFDLREVGVDREVGGEVRTHSPLHVDADAAPLFVELIGRSNGVILVRRPSAYGISLMSRRGGRFRPVSFAADDTRKISKPRVHRREIHLLVLAADVALDVEAPRLVRRRSGSAAS